MSKILFSCLGNTDIKEKENASLMRTIDYIRDLNYVYIYVTDELRDDIDDYVKVLKNSFPKLNIKVIQTGEKEPHRYDNAIEQLENEFNKIIEKHNVKKDEFIFNIASGTPAQKSALIVISEFKTINIKLLQANNPRYDEPRMDEITTKNLSKKIIQKNIIELCENYEYQGGLDLLVKNEEIFNEEVFSQAKNKIEKQKNRHLFIIDNIVPKQKKLTHIYESILWLDILRKKEYYHDFIRALTPTMSEILILLVKRTDNEINNYFVENNATGALTHKVINCEIVKEAKIKINSLDSNKKPIYFYNWQWFEIIELLYKNSKDLLKSCEYVLKYEKLKRNDITHSLQIIRNDGNTSKYKVDEVIRHLKNIFSKLVDESYPWNAYDVENKKMESLFS